MQCGQYSRARCSQASNRCLAGVIILYPSTQAKNLPIDNIELMKMLKRQQELRAVEPRSLLIEPLFTLQVVE